MMPPTRIALSSPHAVQQRECGTRMANSMRKVNLTTHLAHKGRTFPYANLPFVGICFDFEAFSATTHHIARSSFGIIFDRPKHQSCARSGSKHTPYAHADIFAPTYGYSYPHVSSRASCDNSRDPRVFRMQNRMQCRRLKFHLQSL